MSSQVKTGAIFVLVVGIVLAILGLITLRLTWRSIRPGYVGILFDKANHRVTAEALEPGWAFINPFTKALQEYPVTIRTYSMVQAQGEGSLHTDDSIKVQSNEGQQVNLDVVIQYQVIKQEAGELYQDWGGASIEAVELGIVRQYTRSQVPVIASRYGWEDVTSGKRSEIVKEISEALAPEFKKRHLNLVSFGIREVHLPAPLQTALNQKIQAQQLAEQQRYQLRQAEVRAQQDVTEASGKANAMKAAAEGEAAAILVRAKAQAEANDLLSKSLTKELIQYQQIQRWDGRLPAFTGGSATPLIDMSKLSGGSAER